MWEIQVLEEGSKGFLGLLGSKQARVKIIWQEQPADRSRKFIQDVLAVIGIEAELEIKNREDQVLCGLHGKELGVLIGHRGETLDALQYLVNLVVNREAGSRVKVILDIEDYRLRREQTLVRLAKRLSDKVKQTGSKVVLEPMSPQERRIIHTTLQHDKLVSTISEGQEPYRKVVIVPKQ